MLLNQLEDSAIGILIVMFFIFPLSVYSLKYNAVRHKANREDMNIFLLNLSPLFRAVYSRNLKGIYYDDTQHTPEQIENSLFLQRIIVSIIPVMFNVVTLFVFARSIINNDSQILRNLIDAVLIPIFFLAAWRFGQKIKQIVPDS
jgi:hypothetical protein